MAIATAISREKGRAIGGTVDPDYGLRSQSPYWIDRLPRANSWNREHLDPRMEHNPPPTHDPISTDDMPDWHIGAALGGGLPHRQYGGEASPALPSVTTSNPIYKGLYQRYASMTPEQLQEFVLRAGNTSQGQVAQHILQQKRMMPAAVDSTLQSQQPQTPAITSPQTASAGTEPQGYAMGGGMGLSMSQADPWWTRQESREASDGFLHSSIPGRTDHIPASPAADSYVIPADVVSGLGEGNSLAGARILDMAFRTGPYGTQMPRGGGGHGAGMPHPRAPSVPAEESRGGARIGQGLGEKVPIMAAGGEFIVPPHVVRAIGRGSRDRGLNLLDKWVVRARKGIVKTMSKLPGPVRN